MSELIRREDALLYLCKYQIPNLIFMKDDERFECESDNILAVEYLCDYEFNLRAVLKVSLRLDIRRKLWIMKNKRDIICKFELDKIGCDLDIEKFVTSPEEVFNMEFAIYMNDDDENSDIETLEKRLKQNELEHPSIDEIETETYHETQNLLDVYLFDQELVNSSKQMVNIVFTKDTVQSFVARILTETKHKKVLISSMENGEVYTEQLVPAYPCYKALAYLDQYVGMYKKGAIIFYDYDCLYIINANGKVTAKQEDEWSETTIIVNRLMDATPGDGMIRLPDEKVFYISVPEMAVVTQKPSIDTNVGMGSEAKIVVIDDIEIEFDKADQSYIDKRNEELVYRQKADNKYALEMLKCRLGENECIMYLSANNLDVQAFTPNKTYKFVFDDEVKQKKYGDYRFRIVYAYHMMRATSNTYMDSAHRIIFKRCPD
ncbi:MAG: hypothetical protein K2N48_01185 [Muribaculaceae bacterium]|nr:hypothetical protein [Muribaculaceae bacterium]